MDFRHEYKYIISTQQALILKNRIATIMSRDAHTGQSGAYEIRSIYFDDMNDSCYYQNEAGTDPRSKYRIRIYNGSKDQIVLEKKIKQNGMTKKLHQDLTMAQYEMLTGMFGDEGDVKLESFEPDLCHIGHQLWNFDEIYEEPSLIQELLILKQTRLMQPKVIVAYERTPFVENNGNVRVTFDDGICSSADFEAFFHTDLHARKILPQGQTLMEVKFDEFLPAYIKEVLENGHMRQTTFSKYYLCRRYHL